MNRRTAISRRWPDWAYPIADSLLRLKSFVVGSGYPLHRNEAVRPCFVVGAPRSGNTLLRRILEASPQVHIPPETYVLGDVITTFRRNSHRPWRFILRLALGLFEYHPEFDRFNVCLRPLFHRLMETPERMRSLALILDSLYRYHGESLGKTCERWGDKTPLNVYCLPQIQRVFQAAQFIHIVRDGADSVHSMLVKTEFAWDLRQAARRWSTSVSAARKFVRRNPECCHEVRYESLVNDPHGSMNLLCRFLDIPFEPAMVESVEHGELLRDLSTAAHHVNVLQPIMTNSIGKGRRQLTRAQRMELQKLIGRNLERMGYDPIA